MTEYRAIYGGMCELDTHQYLGFTVFTMNCNYVREACKSLKNYKILKRSSQSLSCRPPPKYESYLFIIFISFLRTPD